MKLIVIGLDGVNRKILDRFSDVMPNLTALREKWGLNILQSVIPTNSVAAWTSFATGKTPDEHGLFDFLTGDGNRRPISLVDLKTYTIWDYLSYLKKSVVVINQPGSYPVREVNGKIISGMLADSLNLNSCYPEKTLEIIKKKFNFYKIDIEAYDYKEISNRLDLLKSLRKISRTRFETGKYLYENDNPDYFELIFTNTDRILHYYFDIIEEDYEDENIDDIKKEISGFFRDIDSYLKYFIDRIKEESSLIILSDHGFHRIKRIFYLNRWLVNNRWTVLFKGKDAGLFERVINKYYLLRFKRLLKKRKIRHKIFDPPINWFKTTAFATSSTAEGVFINFGKERLFPAIKNVRIKKEITEELISELRKIKDPINNSIVFEKISLNEKFYSAKYSSKLPDIIFSKINDDYFISDSYEKGDLFSDSMNRSGEHSLNGIFLGAGKGFRFNENSTFSIIDVFPTISNILQLPVPDDISGKIMKQTLVKVNDTGVILSDKINFKTPALKDSSDKDVMNRLRAIGYIE